MPTPEECLTGVVDLCHELVDQLQKVSQAVSTADRLVSEIYHEMEMKRFNAVEGYLLAKRLQGALLSRLQAKAQHSRLQLLADFAQRTMVLHQQVTQRLGKREAGDQQHAEAVQSPVAAEAAATVEWGADRALASQDGRLTRTGKLGSWQYK